MAAQERGGIRASIPWLALGIVTIFAFNQLSQRNRALGRATKAEDNVRALQMSPGPGRPRPTEGQAGITEREKKLDAALQAALEVTRADTRRLSVLAGERDEERARAERLAAQLDAESARASALAGRIAAFDEGAAARAARLVKDLAAERQGRGSDLTQHERVLAASVARQATLLAKEERAHTQDVTQLQVGLNATTERANRIAIALVTEQAARAREVDGLQKSLRAATERADRNAAQHAEEGARLAAQGERAAASRKQVVALEAKLARVRAEQATATRAQKQERGRVSAQLEATAAALGKVEKALVNSIAQLDKARVRETSLLDGRAAAEKALVGLRRRLRAVATAPLAAEDKLTLITGVRMVSLLRLGGATARLLTLTDHEDADVAAAAAHGLANAPDLSRVVLPASDAALALLAEDTIGLRMAGLALIEAATGKKTGFDPGAPAHARAAALKKLKQQLGS